MPNQNETNPTPDPTYTDTGAIGELAEKLRHYAGPERAFRDVYDDTKAVWDIVTEHGDDVDVVNPAAVESVSAVEISTGDLSESWGKATPGVVEVQAISLIGEDETNPDTRIIQFTLINELDEHADPLYIGSFAVTRSDDNHGLPVIRYHSPNMEDDFDSYSEWPELDPSQFEFDPQSGETRLKSENPDESNEYTDYYDQLPIADDPANDLHLRALLSTLESTENYLYHTDLENEPDWPATKKADVVLRLLGGEDADDLYEETGVEAYRIDAWRKEFIEAGRIALMAREAPKGKGGRRQRR